MMFGHKVIPLWIVIYQSNINEVYNFISYDAVINHVNTTLCAYQTYGKVGPAESHDDYRRLVLERLGTGINEPLIVVLGETVRIQIYKYELDQSNPLSSLLADCFQVLHTKGLEEDLQDKIVTLFKDRTIGI